MADISTENIKFGKLTSKIGASFGALNKNVAFKIDKNSLIVYQSQNPNLKFFELLFDQAFLSTRLAFQRVKYDEAMLMMQEDIKHCCIDQSINSMNYSDNRLTLNGLLSSDFGEVPYELSVEAWADQAKIKVNLASSDYKRVSLRYSIEPDENFFGFGEQLSYANLRGRVVPIKVEESGVGRGSTIDTGDIPARGSYYNTYAPLPVYISSKLRGMYLNNTSYSLFDFRSDSECVLDVWDQNLSAVFTRGDSPLAIIGKHSHHLGRQKPLPPWAHRSILGLQGGRKKVEAITEDAIRAGHPVGAIWIQDWVGKRQTPFGSRLWWRWQADENSYPEFTDFIKSMNRKKVEVLGYINTFLADEGDQFQEARAKNLLVKNQQGEDYKLYSVGTPMYLLDLTNPATEKWIKRIIKENMIEVGLAGWMADFGEYLPFDAVLHSGIDPAIYHNQYSVDWSRINSEAIKEAGKEGEIVFFTRAGFMESAKYSPMFWTGDQLVTFDDHDGLSSAITGVLSSGISGISLNHSDIGGYTTTSKVRRNKELFLRWAEMAAFMPFFRTHEGNRPEDNHQFYSDQDTQEKFAHLGRLHHALESYFSSLEMEAAEHGHPVVRHLFLHYPWDHNTFSITKQFLLGEDLLVCPATEAGMKEISGYFPEGNWKSIWSNEVFKGPAWHDIPVPFGKPAAFTREGGRWSQTIRSLVSQI